MYKREDEKDVTMAKFKPWSMDLDNYMEENEPAREVDITTFVEEGTEYLIPEYKEGVKSTFSQLYVGRDNVLLDTSETCHTLYEDEPSGEGHATDRFRMKMVIPDGKYELTDDCRDTRDVVFAFYRKGTGRPLSCRYADRMGSLESVTLNEYRDYGEYFVLIANIEPVEELRKFFTRMGNCWRYDFVFLPNGIDMSHPEVTAELTKEHRLQLSFDNSFRAELSRFTVKCFDADYRLIGMNDDLKLGKGSRKVCIRPNGTFAWTEECCHVVLLHNLVPFVHLSVGTKGGNPVSAEVEIIGECDRLYWLGNEIGGDPSLTKRWNAIRGNRAAKKEVLDFISEHDVDDYQVIVLPMEGPDMDALVCFSQLIYPGELVECYDVEQRLATGETALKCLSDDADLSCSPVRVLCVTNIHLFDSPGGEACRQAVEAFGEMEGRAVIYQDIRY